MVAANVVVNKTGADGKPLVYNAKMTIYMWMVTVVGSFGGLLFGYDIGVTGGVSSMTAFLKQFFPAIAAQSEAFQNNPANNNAYCTFNSGLLQFFTSIAFIAGFIGAPLASICTQKHGRKVTLLTAGGMYLVGAALMCSAYYVGQIFIGRVCIGFGSGFANQVTPIFLSESAPAQWRGALNICFQLCTTIGIFVAQLINFGVNNHPRAKNSYGWRISLGIQGVPAVMILVGGIFLPDTPNSLVERGYDDKALKILRRLRGVQDVEFEFNDIKAAAEEARREKAPWRTLFKPNNAFMATTCVVMPFFQQFSGVNIIMFYAPQIFVALGNGSQASLLQTVINGSVNVAGTFVAIGIADKLGRKILLLEGGYQMIICIMTFAGIIGRYLNKGGLPKRAARGAIAMAALFVAGYAWSWGPITWLIPTEILTLETRSAGNGLNTSINFLFTFVVGQVFLSMFCAMEYGAFIFFGFWVIVATLFVHLFVVETFRTPLEEVHLKYMNHWFWKRVQKGHQSDLLQQKQSEKVADKTPAEENGAAPEQPNADLANV